MKAPRVRRAQRAIPARRVRRAQEVGNILDGFIGEQAKRFRRNLQERAITELMGGDALGGEEPVLRLIGPEGEQIGIRELRRL